jgi:F-type H+-transporting ATPase subunit epsilon
MNLKVLLPSEVFLSAEVTKVVAEAENGFFCLMPQHVDFTAALVPSVFSYTAADGGEHYLAVDVGTLVKKGSEILVSTGTLSRGPELGHLKDVVIRQFEDDRERGEKGPCRRRPGWRSICFAALWSCAID